MEEGVEEAIKIPGRGEPYQKREMEIKEMTHW